MDRGQVGLKCKNDKSENTCMTFRSRARSWEREMVDLELIDSYPGVENVCK